MKVQILLIVYFLSLSVNGYTASIKEIYELQEQCKIGSEAWFEETHSGSMNRFDDGSSIMVNYKNHYNTKLNKCLILEETRYFPLKEKYVLIDRWLYDLHETNSVFATSSFLSYFSTPDIEMLDALKGRRTVCSVRGTKCNSKAEWDALLNHLMKE